MDEKYVLVAAKFYDDTRTWRKELTLAGYKCFARLIGNMVLMIEDSAEDDEYWTVDFLVAGPHSFRVIRYDRNTHDRVELDTVEEVMTYVSDQMRTP